MSPKPIFIIGFPADCPPEIMRQAYKDLDAKIGDEYHVLSYFSHRLADPSFQMLSVNNAPELEIELLKKMFLELYESAKNSKDIFDVTEDENFEGDSESSEDF